jgi:hypothetical protein
MFKELTIGILAAGAIGIAVAPVAQAAPDLALGGMGHLFSLQQTDPDAGEGPNRPTPPVLDPGETPGTPTPPVLDPGEESGGPS